MISRTSWYDEHRELMWKLVLEMAVTKGKSLNWNELLWNSRSHPYRGEEFDAHHEAAWKDIMVLADETLSG